MNHHLVILKRPYLEAIWPRQDPRASADAGSTAHARARCPRDRLLLKASGGMVRALATVEAVEHYEDLTPSESSKSAAATVTGSAATTLSGRA
jgi:hypothetical protein